MENNKIISKIIEGKLIAKGLKFAIVVSRFNNFITDRLLEGAIDALIRHEVNAGDIEIFKVPGSFELPIVVKKLTNTKQYNAVIALGCIIKGGTPHFEYIAAEVTKGLAQVALDTCIPVSFGVLTTEDIEQAIERAGTKQGNKGWEAAVSAIEMVNLMQKI